METRKLNASNGILVDPVSVELAQYFLIIVLVIGCGFVSLLGIATNIVNIIIFLRQRFKDTINISLLALAIADLMCVISMFWISFSCSPFFIDLHLPINAYDLTYMTGTWTRLCSNRITGFINAFITLERCVCIAMPLKVKNIFTSFKTKVINIAIFIFMVGIFSPFYLVNKLEWRYDLTTNRSLLTLIFTEDKVHVETITFPIHSVAMSVISLATVILCTFILVAKLNEKSKWRQQTVAKLPSTLDKTVLKEKQVVKMITSISVIFIFCYTPSTITFVMMTCNSEFSIAGKFKNMFYVVWSLTVLLETMSSSVNFFVYLQMSSKFRETCGKIFSKSMKF